MRVRTGKLRISGQNTWYTHGSIRVPGNVCTISGSFFHCLGTTAQANTWAGYLAVTQQDVQDRLAVFLTQHPEVHTDTRGTIIIDMEGQTGGHSCHASDLHEETDADKALVIASWKLRHAACRAVFPNARIGQYGTPVPNSRGTPDNAVWLARIAALIQAGTVTGYSGQGSAWDALDILVPVLYTRFGPSDSVGAWTSQAAMTLQGVVGAQSILKSTGSAIPVVPLLSTYVANGGSDDDNRTILSLNTPDPMGSTWGQQFPVFKDYGVSEVVVWNQADSKYARDGSGPAPPYLLSDMVHCGKGWG